MSKRIGRITTTDLQQAEDIDIVKEEEHWNVYELGDGTKLKVKIVLQGVKRLKKWSPDGTPIYVINSSNVLRISNVRKELKAKPKPSTFQPV